DRADVAALGVEQPLRDLDPVLFDGDLALRQPDLAGSVAGIDADENGLLGFAHDQLLDVAGGGRHGWFLLSVYVLYVQSSCTRFNPRSHMADIISLATYRTKCDSLPSHVKHKQDEPSRCSFGATELRLISDGIRCHSCDPTNAK